MYKQRTTSFLEQDHSAKARVKKQRNKRQSIAKALQVPKPNSSAAPRPVSTKTKDKLDTFAFKKPTPLSTPRTSSQGASTENGADQSRNNNDNENERKHESTLVPNLVEDGYSSPGKEPPKTHTPSRVCPQTPAPRLPLKDLVKTSEDGKPPFSNVTSPEERIVWQVSPRSTPHAASQITPVPKRKRARSSSPIGSPMAAVTPVSEQLASHRGPKKPPKTPHADPANDVWQRYSSTSNVRPANQPLLARLLSGETPKGLNLSPLRRSYSCGPDWPPARLKRRRTTSTETENQDAEELDKAAEDGEVAGPATCQGRQRVVKSRINRVNMLLDKVHEKLAKSSTPPELTTSSPTRENDGSFYMPSSPTKNATSRRGVHNVPSKIKTAVKPQVASDSEDYDDFDGDLDFEMLDKVEEVAVAFTQQNQKGTKAAKDSTIPQVFDFDEFDFDEGDEALSGIDVDKLVLNHDRVFEKPTRLISVQPQAINGIVQVATQDAAEVVAEFRDVDFDDWDDEELESSVDIISGTNRRFVVQECTEGSWRYRDKEQPQKILRLRDEQSGKERLVYLRQDWYYVNAEKGDIVHVIGKSSKCIIDNASGMIVVNPDFLVSSTTVADSFGCTRRAVLQERVKASADISKPLVYGNILHELFQKALTANDFSNKFLHDAIDALVLQHLESLYILKEDVPEAKAYIKSKAGLLQNWAQLFVSAIPKKEAIAVDHRGSEVPNICISKVLDIEEHIWSPRYGLKGHIDATVQTTISDRKSQRTLTVPFELKTGKTTNAALHRAQTMIYTLLMEERYDIDVFCGLLYYMETSELIRVPALSSELRGMIIARNELAWYAKNRDTLPPVIRKHTCSSCFAGTTCFIYHKALEDGTAESAGAEKQFEELTGHLNDLHKDFLRHWDQLLSKEEADMTRFRKELWTMTSAQREAKGRCFGNLTIIPESIIVAEEGSRINKFTYALRKADNTPMASFLDSQIGVGDAIVISDEKGHFALALGFVIEIRRTSITVSVDRRLHNTRTREEGFDANDNQIFVGIMNVGYSAHPIPIQDNTSVLLRLDKDELTGGMALIRNNLIQLLSTKSRDRTRELIIEKKAPVFRTDSTAHSLDHVREHLNEDQIKAIEKILAAHDYALILGMPGTGKTTTIGHIIRTLVSQGKNILLTSYTHTAVDNILLKIKDDGIATLRLGNLTKVHPEVKDFAILAESPRTSFQEINDAFMLSKVVATTCLGINHPIFNERLFDYCIVDEASQITLPVCLGPIRMAKKFILVGDHYQLPPLVRNAAAKEGGLDISLFKLLSEAHPHAVVSLEHQYRMCEDIMLLSNKLIYDGRLKCGDQEVAQRTLKLLKPGGLSRLHSSVDINPAAKLCDSKQCWIQDLLQERVKVCFVDTDKVPAMEVKKCDRIDNPVEAELACQLVEALIDCGVEQSSIGVISVYRSQIRAIQYLLRGRPDVEMHTADKFQGRDKECIIISLVRSNDQQNIGDLLKDWRRINVAFTRARSKLIILGSKSTLLGNELLKNFVELMEDRHWIYQLPENAHLKHTVSALSTQRSPMKRQRIQNENSPKMKANGQKGPKTGLRTGKLLFGNRPVLKDIVNDIGIFEQ